MYTTLVCCVVFKNSCISLPCYFVSGRMGTRWGVFYQRLSLLALLSNLLWTPCRSCRGGVAEGLRRSWPQFSLLIPLAGDILGCSVLVQDDKDTQGSVLMDVCTPEGTQVPYHGKKGRGSLCLYLFISYRAVCFTSSWGNLAERSPSPLLGEAGEEQKIK